MQIQQVQSNPAFSAKQRFLTPEAKKNMQTLLHKMNKETVMDKTEITAVENFDNKEVVEKRFLGIRGFTQKGNEIIQNALNEVRKGLK